MQAEHNQEDSINAVGGVVYRYDPQGQIEVLLIKKRFGFWTLPKGYIKPGETEEAALLREIEEETGIVGTMESAVQQVSYTIFKKGKPRSKTVNYYLLQAKSGRAQPNKKEGIQKLRWFPLRAALKRIKRGRVRRVARQAGELIVGTSGEPLV